jgi:hypothetical protein
MTVTSAVRVSVVTVLIVSTSACESGVSDLPVVPKPLDYGTTYVDLPGCDVRLPPVHDVPRCSPDEIGTRVDAGEICELLKGLKEWTEASDWRLARSSCVSDVIAEWPHRPGQRPQRVLTVYVDVPERSEVWFAQKTEGQATVDYFVSPR